MVSVDLVIVDESVGELVSCQLELPTIPRVGERFEVNGVTLPAAASNLLVTDVRWTLHVGRFRAAYEGVTVTLTVQRPTPAKS